MKLTMLFLLTGLGLQFPGWQPDLETAKRLAKEKHKLILLNFSGSDWCGPCIQLHKEVFNSNDFSAMADSCLVLVNADFPRNRKNQLPKETQRRNDALAEQYNPSGRFPLTLLLSADGKVLRSWEGFPRNDSRQFILNVKSTCDALRTY